MTFSLRKRFFMSRRLIIASLFLGMPLVACTSSGTYPSLLPREAEKQSLSEPEAPAPVVAVADPALDARIAVMATKLEQQTASFESAATRAARQVAAARGVPAGGESWLDAHVALAELDSLRSGTVEIVAELDDAASERALTLAPPYSALDAMVQRARDAAKAQAARIAALQAGLAPA